MSRATELADLLDYGQKVAKPAASELRRLDAEVEALRKDAERYRKWRADYTDAVANNGDGSCVTEMLLALADAWTPEDVDAAIDAARGAK